MEKIRIFVDMDGTIFPFNVMASLETVSKKGYFARLVPYMNMVKLLKQLKHDQRYDIYLLSSVFQDGHSGEDKMQSVIQWMPWMKDRTILAEYGRPKKDFISEPRANDILLDDFTDNLLEWHGVGIKIYNGINGTRGRWNGYSVSNIMPEEVLYNQLTGIIAAVTGTIKAVAS